MHYVLMNAVLMIAWYIMFYLGDYRNYVDFHVLDNLQDQLQKKVAYQLKFDV